MTTRDPIARRLARNIRAVTADGLTDKARTRVVIGIVDNIAVALAGAHEDCVRIVQEIPGIGAAPGPSTLFGHARRVSMLDAAMINGVAAHALDYDDFSSMLGVHHSATLVAPLLALAEAEHKSGAELVAAHAAGVETEIRLARSVAWSHYDKGWHPTSTMGTIGVAAACAHMLGLDEAGIATALTIAASQSAGIKANFGTMTKPLHVGIAARAGLMSALLAERGFTADETAFEHRQGFFEVYNGAGNYDAAKLFENWGAPWELEGDGMVLKLWPCCGSTHAAIVAALELRDATGIAADDIARIEVMPHRRRLRHTDTPHPRTSLEGKFSVQYVVARALADGAVTLGDFAVDRVTEPRIARLLDRLEAKGHPEMGDDADSQWAAEVVVETVDGRRLARRIDNVLAEGRLMPENPAALADKFIDCAELALPPVQAARLFETLLTIDRADDVADLGHLLLVSETAENGPRAQAAAV